MTEAELNAIESLYRNQPEARMVLVHVNIVQSLIDAVRQLQADKVDLVAANTFQAEKIRGLVWGYAKPIVSYEERHQLTRSDA